MFILLYKKISTTTFSTAFWGAIENVNCTENKNSVQINLIVLFFIFANAWNSNQC